MSHNEKLICSDAESVSLYYQGLLTAFPDMSPQFIRDVMDMRNMGRGDISSAMKGCQNILEEKLRKFTSFKDANSAPSSADAEKHSKDVWEPGGK